ncbi:MAG: CBS domain-containing protein [Planctomycetota bacterium]|nr:CBS domain-containing protein [Planctomycetota bacterium]
MGHREQNTGRDRGELRVFMRALLADVHALERMLEEGLVESGVRRIGAEQELFLVKENMDPAPCGVEVLDALDGDGFTAELGLFNLEANLRPRLLRGDSLSGMEAELIDCLERAGAAARSRDASILLAGILPTLRREHLTLENMTPAPRYRELNRVMTELRGGEFSTLIKGLDELHATHDNVMLEACNTSFQVHFQVGPDEFAALYNLAQAITAPVLAAAVNSPVLLGHRLWHETRVALFQQSLDARSRAHQARGSRQRVSFGDHWIERSVMEIYREDVARFKVLIAGERDEDPVAVLDRGEIPALRALCLHNGTVYRWNRPCYGVKDGVAHLRIENRALPAGPTIADEVANAAFYFGLLSALAEEAVDVREVMEFDDARANFVAAARYGLDARLTWMDGRSWAAEELILERLLPMAHEGLRVQGVDDEDRERFLGLIAERVESGRTGARWALDSLARMGTAGSQDARSRALAAAMQARQLAGEPVHRWAPAALEVGEDPIAGCERVGQLMTTDLFTVHPEDLVDLAASLMDWRHLRHVPVEDDEGVLLGILSHRRVLRLVGRGMREGGATVAVREVMQPDPVTVTPETPTLAAIGLMRERQVSALPVVSEGRLVGIVTEHDFLAAAAGLLEERLGREDEEGGGGDRAATGA